MDKIEAKRVFGENLKRLRLAVGMSQDELAKALGYTNRSSINKIELGKNDMPRNKIAKAAIVLGVSPLEFFQEERRPQETMPEGTYRGGAQKPDIWLDFESLSENDKKQVVSYIKFLKSKEGDNE